MSCVLLQMRHHCLLLFAAISLSSSLTIFPQHAAAQTPASPPRTSAECVRDDFTGAALDKSRWPTVVRGDTELRVENGSLIIPTTNTDLFGAGGTTPDIVLQQMPTGPFTATVKLAVVARAPYQQAGLIVYSDDDNYAKVVFAARSATATVRRVEFLREENGAPVSDLSDRLAETYPDSVYIRFTRDSTLHASYSSDGKSFTDVPATAPIPTLANAKIGLVALSGNGTAPVIPAKFDWFELCKSQ